jgi:hypothetical protein
VLLLTAISATLPSALAVKPVLTAPVVGLRLTMSRLVWPLTVLKLPPTKIFVPSGDASTESTPPLMLGANAVLTRPVSRLYIASPGRV